MMKRKRPPLEGIRKNLSEAATPMTGGPSVEEVCEKLEVSPPTYHRWPQEYGEAKEGTVKWLKELEKENLQPKRLVADQALDISILKEVATGFFIG